MTRKRNLFTMLMTLIVVPIILTGGKLNAQDWNISVLPPSIRLDPSSGKVLEAQARAYDMKPIGNVLEKNWIYDGSKVNLKAARGEYVSFVFVLENKSDSVLHEIVVEMDPFKKGGETLNFNPELYLVWAVEVKQPSSGYEHATLGPGWYPEACIPLDDIQMKGVREMRNLRWPLELPDFRNRIDNQKYLEIWVDQYVPFDKLDAAPGVYTSTIRASVGDQVKTIPVELEVWNFAIPQKNNLAGNLQHEGFLRHKSEKLELEIYQLFKKHRVVPADPTYDPSIKVTPNGDVDIDFEIYDKRLKKYFTGEAFTEKYGYRGPGYGMPIEQFVLPFDVYSKHDVPGWPAIVWDDLPASREEMVRYRAAAELEREPDRQAVYINAINKVRDHILTMVDTSKTDLVVYLNGLDESYFPEAWQRMDFWGKVFKDHFPEVNFRVDGSYSEEAMEIIHDVLDYWCCHTIGYDMPVIEKYRKMGVTDWVYGPQLYEGEYNGWCGSSTFMDLELTNERLISWASFKYRTHTFCSWGIGSGWDSGWYNSETWKDYFRDHGTGPLSFRRYNGNAMAIYAPGVVPGVRDVCASVRLKNMRDGVEEWEMMNLLAGLDGNYERVDAIVNRIVNHPYGKAAIGKYNEWNHNPAEWDEARNEIGRLISEKMD